MPTSRACVTGLQDTYTILCTEAICVGSNTCGQSTRHCSFHASHSAHTYLSELLNSTGSKPGARWINHHLITTTSG